MQRPSDTLKRALRALAAGLLVAGAAGLASAQDKAAAPATAAAAAAPAAMPGIQGQNIMDVKPEAARTPTT